MVRRYTKKRTYKKKRKTYKRRKFVPRAPRSRYNLQFVKVKRSVDYLVPTLDLNRGTYGCFALLSCGCAATLVNNYTSAAYDFKVSDISNITEFGLMFDQYRLMGVKMLFQYITSSTSIQYPNTGATVNPQNSLCTLAITSDFDDSTAYSQTNAGWSALQETGRAKYMVFPNAYGNKLKYYVKPRIMTGVTNSSGTVVAGATTRGQWLDGALTPDVLYRGVKVILQVPPGDTEMQSIIHSFRCTCVYYVQFRQRQ